MSARKFLWVLFGSSVYFYFSCFCEHPQILIILVLHRLLHLSCFIKSTNIENPLYTLVLLAVCVCVIKICALDTHVKIAIKN
jgi:hypothetical protein